MTTQQPTYSRILNIDPKSGNFIPTKIGFSESYKQKVNNANLKTKRVKIFITFLKIVIPIIILFIIYYILAYKFSYLPKIENYNNPTKTNKYSNVIT